MWTKGRRKEDDSLCDGGCYEEFICFLSDIVNNKKM